MQTTEAPKEDVRSTFVHQRAIASTRHADREAARTRSPTSRLQQKMTMRGPPPEPCFFAEKARAGKCVFLSVGLLIFGQFSGPGKLGALSGPRKDRSGTRAGGSRDARATKNGHPSMQAASGEKPVRIF